jgi:hypothetical protein
MWKILLVGCILFCLSLYVYLHMFLVDGSPGAKGNEALDVFVNDTIGGRMMSSVCTRGYV